MTGIISYGAYIPAHRLERAQIAKAWGLPPMIPGEKAMANYDEDSITMSVAACLDCIGDLDRSQIDGLYLATTTSPYKEKQAASIVTKALDLHSDVSTADYANSLRSGTIALKAAIDAVKSGTARQVLVVASDCRLGAPQGQHEMGLGDGAAALLVGSADAIAEVSSIQTVCGEMLDVWRTQEDRFVRSWEDRFIIGKGYMRLMIEAISKVMMASQLSPSDVTKAVLYGPDPRSMLGLAKILKLDPATQLQDSLYMSVGNTGSAQVLLTLVGALEEAKAGDRLLMAGYGDGVDAFIVEAKDPIGKLGQRRGVKGHLAARKPVSYTMYAKIRQLIPTEAGARPPQLLPSAVVMWRKSQGNLPMNGSKCNQCGNPQFPIQRVCAYCQAKDDYTLYRFSDKKATLVTYTFDNLGLHQTDIPPVPSTVADFEGGGRVFCQGTDFDPEEVQIGMPLEMTFRKMYQVEGVPYYHWKTKPAM